MPQRTLSGACFGAFRDSKKTTPARTPGLQSYGSIEASTLLLRLGAAAALHPDAGTQQQYSKGSEHSGLECGYR